MKARALATLIFALAPVPVQALNFLAFDPRSLSMGGATVAAVRPWNAALYNPALLVDPELSEPQTYVRSYLGGQLTDRDNFLGALRHYQRNDAEARFNQSIAIAERKYSAGSLASTDLRRAADDASKLRADVDRLSDRPLRVTGSGGLNLTVSSSQQGWALHVRRYAIGGGIIDMSRQNQLRIDQGINVLNLLADIKAEVEEIEALARAIGFDRLETLIDQAAATGNVSPELEEFYDFPSVQPLVDDSIAAGERIAELDEYFELDRLARAFDGDFSEGIPDLQQYLRYQTDEEIDADVFIDGVDITELGLSYAAPASAVQGLQLGATLKYLKVETIDFSYGASAFKLDRLLDRQYRKKRDMLNLDLGAAYALSERYQIGLVIKNLVPDEFDTVLGNTIKFRPLARLGLAYSRDDLTLAADIDLSINESRGLNPDQRQLALGAEYRGWQAARLRTGVRINTLTGSYVPTLGIGLGDGKRVLDLALSISPEYDEIGGAIQAIWSF